MTGDGGLSKEDMGDMIESMEHAEAHMADCDQEIYEKKLEETKKVEAVKDEEVALKKAQENRKEPHFCNLNEDPMLS